MRSNIEDFSENSCISGSKRAPNGLDMNAANGAESSEILQTVQQRTDRYLDHLSVSLSIAQTELAHASLVIAAQTSAASAAAAQTNRLLAEIQQRDEAIAAFHRALENRDNDIAVALSKIADLTQSVADQTQDTVSISANFCQENSTQQAALLRRLRIAQEDTSLQKSVLRIIEEILQVMSSPGKWWTALLPAFFVRRLKYDRLRKKGLFDARLYLKRYPDVGRAGSDPLHHYITHGLSEGRIRI